MRFIFIFRLLLASSSLFFKLFKSIIYFLFIVLFIFLFLCVRIQGGFDSHLINLIYDLQLLPKNREERKREKENHIRYCGKFFIERNIWQQEINPEIAEKFLLFIRAKFCMFSAIGFGEM